MTRDGRQNDTPLLLGKYYFSTGTNSHFFCPQMDHFLHRCQHDAFYTNKNTLKGVDHPFSACAKCVTNRLYDPDPCEVCTKWLQDIKEKGVSAEKSGSIWLKWNRSLVASWKHNKVLQYIKPEVVMIVWADAEKFALWEPYLPVPKIRLRREKSGSSDTALPQTSSPVAASLLPAGQGVAPQVTPVHPTTAPLTESCAQPIEATSDPSVGSEWSGFPDDLEEPFPDLFSDLDLAPPVSALNPSQKRACSPEPPGRQEPVEPNAPVSLPAGFSAEQLATIKALIQSCLVPPTLFLPYSASAPSLPAPVLTTTPASDTPRAGPSWVSVPPPPTTPLTGPSGILPSQSLSPRPGPSWASDPPLVEETGELTGATELLVLSDSEEGDAVTPPVGRSRLDPLHLAAAEVLDRLWHETPADISPIPIPGIQGHTESTIYYYGSRIHYNGPDYRFP